MSSRSTTATEPVGFAVVDDRAPLEHHRPIGDGEGPVDLLLDHQRAPACPVDAARPVVDVVDDDRRQPERELVDDEQGLGGTASTWASDSIRCWPPDSVPPSWRRRSARTGKAA